VDNSDDCDDTSADVTTGDQFYRDADGDGYGNADDSTTACTAPTGYVSDNTDCNDDSAAANPGAEEVCDSIDNDCDNLVDDDDDSVDSSTFTRYFGDSDGDGFGNFTDQSESCLPADGYVANSDDCNDDDAAQYVGAECTWTDPDNADLTCSSTYTTTGEGSVCLCQAADDDADGVCNDADQCPGEDDNLDANEDGVPDCQESVCEPQKKKWESRRLKKKKNADPVSTSMEFAFPAYNCTFIVDNVNRRWARYDDHVTVTYVDVNGDSGSLEMTGSELKVINAGIWGRKRDDWNVNLYDVIGETGVTSITVTLDNLETGNWRKTARVYLRNVKYCGSETENFKPRKLEDEDLD